jgi:hypothetical protein
MKLTELNPRWTSGTHWLLPDGSTQYNEVNYLGRDGMGITFDCPVHRNHRLGVFFENPLDGQPAQAHCLLWKRTGDTFETLTLAPSIQASCWHGFITGGEVG